MWYSGGGGVLYDGLTLENGGGALAGGNLVATGKLLSSFWRRSRRLVVRLTKYFQFIGGGFVTELLATNNRWTPTWRSELASLLTTF